MTDEEALKEIDRQENRFAAAGFENGLRLAKSAREYYQTIVKCRQKSAEVAAECAAAQEKAVAMTAETDRMEAEARQMLKEVSRRRSAVAKLRKVVRNGDLIRNQEHKARLKFEEKVKQVLHCCSYLRSEGEDIYRIGQTGVVGAKETRLYVYVRIVNGKIYKLTFGDKDSQQRDINRRKQIVRKFKKVTK